MGLIDSRRKDGEIEDKEHSEPMTRMHRYVNIVVHSLDGKPIAIFPDIAFKTALKLMREMVTNGIDGYKPHEFMMLVGATKPKTDEDLS